MTGVEVFTSEDPSVESTPGRASRNALQIVAFYHHTAAIDPNPAETTTCAFAQLDICFRRLARADRQGEAHHKVRPAGFKYLVTEMLCWAAGGPQRYSGRSMEESHRDMAITPSEWQAFMDDVQTTLDKFSVPAEEQAEVKALVESTRATIVALAA
jgi:hemoglobin